MKLRKIDLILVDGMNTAWRQAHTVGHLGVDTPDGFVETGTVYGFLKAILHVARLCPKAQVAIVWEGSNKRRKKILPEYKARRNKPTDEKWTALRERVFAQMDLLKEALSHTSWLQLRAGKWEADDVILSAAANNAERKGRTLVYSNDKDLLQCLGKRTIVYRASNAPVWTVERLAEEWGVEPHQVPHVKALSGDASDEYKGARGIGDVWARRFVAKYGSVEGVIAAVDELPTGKAAGLRETTAYVRKCFRVAELQRVKFKTTRGSGDAEALEELFYRLRFGTLTGPPTLKRFTR